MKRRFPTNRAPMRWGTWPSLRRVHVYETILVTEGLGVSDFVYRIIALFVSVVSGMDSEHRHGHSEREARDSVP